MTNADARAAIEARIEQLIDILDALDGDIDLEDNGDVESSLGGGSGDDRELDTSDDEYSLGWSIPTTRTAQGAGYTAFVTDLEADADDEPSMGWTERYGLGPKLDGFSITFSGDCEING